MLTLWLSGFNLIKILFLSERTMIVAILEKKDTGETIVTGIATTVINHASYAKGCASMNKEIAFLAHFKIQFPCTGETMLINTSSDNH